ncbi:peroxidase [Telmatocola sphagniphila]|uniref:Peroxidase n=1 Tax=Telmatocola sphagniphila TaxID=1123043 RepID=A0A8E6B3L1_9BACT|nr:peroxidase family protein [Telmatocola sphagniphila]QVL31318.1 peroxidase [Telmatocola sphagniphila]
MNLSHVILGRSNRKKAARPIRKSKTILKFETLEDRLQPSVSVFRPITEVGNNVANPTWGVAGTDLIRLTAAAYSNGINSPSLPQDQSARAISDILNSQADPNNTALDSQTVNQQSLSDFVYSFGQFMDHDMDLTLDNGASDPIAVPVGDPIGGSTDASLAFNLSNVDPATGTSTKNPAQDITSITAYLDLSQIYGSDLATDNALRTFSGGQMKTSTGGLPPLDNLTYFTATQLAQINASVGGMANDGPLPESDLYVTGDTRGNENVELTVLQTLFLDNHNKIASELQKMNPTWSDEQIFQEARKLNIAEYQAIVYNEWIPDVLGANALPAYKGYNPSVNPSISNEFSTVAFRFGHSLLSGNVERQGNDGQAVADSVPLSEDFFDSSILNGEGQASTTDPVTGLATTDIGAVLKGDADGDAQAEDPQVINEVRDLLFNEVIPGVGGGQDLIALDIQRGRVNGIGSYNQVREGLGLPAVTSFAQITSNVTVQQELQQAYGNVNNIDAFEGGLAEDPVPGSDVGPLFQKIMVNQFERLRDGDRFFYLNETFTPQEFQIFEQGNTLSKVIENNTDITNLQSDVFIFQASISGTVHGSSPNHAGVPGITVQLEDTSGDILATTKTGPGGHYSFNQLSGPAADPSNASGVSGTGYYQIVLSLPTGVKQVTQSPAAVLISVSGTNITSVDFGINIPAPPPPPPAGHGGPMGQSGPGMLPNILQSPPASTSVTNASSSSITSAAPVVKSNLSTPLDFNSLMQGTRVSNSILEQKSEMRVYKSTQVSNLASGLFVTGL